MARSLLKNANLFASIVDGVALSISRRGFSAASWSVVRGGRSGAGGEEKKVVMMMKEGGAESSSSWVPDPVTGCYRPGNRVVEIDPAELREMVLNNQKIQQH
ncbi:hypothetical protein MRB53_032143 [Persea americana]|uniref:Uncharacterized protein n=2 Tax=Persea americana TaxID=3435 RepID=A0ACC2KQB4_PERAE|nr:hypothetical protein MRB53_031756 [Persea americana]KAJ8623614.1 hypothetical protein MRB53_032143 [Persea americana]|eukprot:TRINITY_DN12103_c0_g1_i1.p1 TRINITY_DN12103_c0_g1~~TRINITY_DN12103_c0_g1_i1.p1  ORF type:complete len:102 (-),score=16.61 TRINITY_DN12103_c0_g1_i1:232-537(-)